MLDALVVQRVSSGRVRGHTPHRPCKQHAACCQCLVELLQARPLPPVIAIKGVRQQREGLAARPCLVELPVARSGQVRADEGAVHGDEFDAD